MFYFILKQNWGKVCQYVLNVKSLIRMMRAVLVKYKKKKKNTDERHFFSKTERMIGVLKGRFYILDGPILMWLVKKPNG